MEYNKARQNHSPVSVVVVVSVAVRVADGQREKKKENGIFDDHQSPDFGRQSGDEFEMDKSSPFLWPSVAGCYCFCERDCVRD